MAKWTKINNLKVLNKENQRQLDQDKSENKENQGKQDHDMDDDKEFWFGPWHVCSSYRAIALKLYMCLPIRNIGEKFPKNNFSRFISVTKSFNVFRL